MTQTPPSQQTVEIYWERLTGVLRYIDAHLDDDLPPAVLARVAHFSPFHFQRIFSACAGESVCDYLRRRRLDRAAHELRSTTAPILTIAQRAGYASQAAFTRAFRSRFAISPKRFRSSRGPDFWHTRPSSVQFDRRGRISPGKGHDAGMAMVRVEILELPAQRIATIRPQERSGMMAAISYGQSAGRLMAWAVERGIDLRGINGIDHGGPISVDEFNCAPAIPLPAAVQPEPWFQVEQVGGGLHAVATFQGKPQTLPQAYQWFYGQWLPISGYEPADQPGFTRADCPPPTAEMLALEEQGLLEQQMMSLPDSIDMKICVPVLKVRHAP